jgi:hypothetical protein
MAKKMNKKKKFEWSKFVCGLIVIYGIANGVIYNVAIFMDKCPDSALAVQSVTTIVGGYMSYLMYQFGLKNSRNKFGIDSDGNPYRQDMSDLYGEDKDVNGDSVG